MSAIRPLDRYDVENEREERLRVQRELDRTHKTDQNIEIGFGDAPFGLIFSDANGVRISVALDGSSNLTATNVDTGDAVTLVAYDDIGGAPTSLADINATEAAELVDLRTDLGTTQAAVTVNADATSTNAGSIASLTTTVSSNTTAIDARVTTATYTSGIATLTAADAAQTIATDTIRATRSNLGSVLNGDFSEGDNFVNGLPPRWSNWNNNDLQFVRPSSVNSIGAVQRQIINGSTPSPKNSGVFQSFTGAFSNTDHELSVTTELISGSYSGAGVFIRYRDSGSSVLGDERISFTAIPDDEGDTSSSKLGVRSFTLTLTPPSGTVTAELFLMAGWTVFAATPANKTLDFHSVSFGPLVGANASVGLLKEAFIGSDGRAYAGFRVDTAATGSDPAVIAATSADGSSEVGLAARIIRLVNVVGSGSVEVMRAVGGLAFFSGPISIDAAGRRLTIGPGHGVSGSEVVLWFGSSSVAPASQSRSNCQFALTTAGKIVVPAGGEVAPLLIGFNQSMIDPSTNRYRTVNVSITGGAPPVSWTVSGAATKTSGALTHDLNGQPASAGSGVDTSFTVTATDASNAAMSRTFDLTP